MLAAAAAVMGYAADSALVWFGVLTFPPHAVFGWPSTLWMAGLWVNLALTLDASMAWLRGRYALAAVAGAVSGPLAYAAGERLGAAVLGPSFGSAMLVVAVEWVVAMPLLLLVAEWTVYAEPGVRPQEARS
jgi:hypothetical protein